jgi:hypothetical protein
MAVHLYSLRHVPEEEAAAIRTLLDEHDIAFYETAAGNWGISSPAIWLKHKEDKERAKQLLEEFHIRWAQTQREHLARQREEGDSETFFDKLKHNPLQVLFYLAIALFILYLSTKPFISL